MESPEPTLAPRRPTHRLAWAVTVLLLPASALGLWFEGQRLWCAEGDAALWVSDIWSAHNSQHLADPYSLSHFSHGLILMMCFMLPGLRKLAFPWQLAIGTAVEVAWELIENTDFVINRYRDATLALGYTGDTIANSVFDVLFFIAGFVVARRVGWKWALGIMVAIDLLMLVWIRDNLTLNVLMLLWPIEAIKQWQMPG